MHLFDTFKIQLSKFAQIVEQILILVVLEFQAAGTYGILKQFWRWLNVDFLYGT